MKKERENYNRIYHATNFLNTDIVTDLPDLFTGLMIDLRDIKTETKMEAEKSELIQLFEKHLGGSPELKQELNQALHPTSIAQYIKGI